MCSAQAGRVKAATDDRTSRARLRDAAVLLFGRDGFKVSVRAIARETGVSPGLILHHFGSKDGLRAACDDYVLGRIRDYKREAVAPGGPSERLLDLAALEESAPLAAYALRCLQEGGQGAKAFLDHFTEDAEAWISAGVSAGTILPSVDEKARARYLTMQGFGAMLLDLNLGAPGPAADFSQTFRGYLARNAVPALELYSQGLLADRSMLQAYLARLPHPPPEEPAP